MKPQKLPIKLAIAYKNFAAHAGISHIGLGVSALNICKVLRDQGINVIVWPIVSPADLLQHLRTDKDVTHVVVSAPWIPIADWINITRTYPDHIFAVNCHSNVGFLFADPRGMELLREGLKLELGTWNFHIAGNSRKFQRWIEDTYEQPCSYLPNLYHLQKVRINRPLFSGGVLRVGCFGAARPLKNCISAAASALEMAADMHVSLEFWISGGRSEGSQGILNSMQAMYRDLPHAKLVIQNWQTWPEFRVTVRHMNLLLQPSHSESFNMVTADGVAEGIPSVVSDAVDWVPEHWKACMDDVGEIARTGRCLLGDIHAPADGLAALEDHNLHGVMAWKEFLTL
jgi:hypothetical protein